MKKSERHTVILIIEDDLNDQFLITDAFKKLQTAAKVQIVNNGAEAIAYINGDEKFADRELFPYPTIIITDLKMPVKDGFAVLEFLKNNPLWAVIPTIVLSASRDLDDIRKAYWLGASSYHVKPSSLEELRELLKALHDYWLRCEVPQIDSTGKQVPTLGQGKLGERFHIPTDPSKTE